MEEELRKKQEQDEAQVGYNTSVSERRVKFSAWILLLLMVLDLSTAGVCSAGTFPMFGRASAVSLSSGSQAEGQPLQGTDDDGCFCCCTHMLPGSVVGLGSPAPVIRMKAVPLFAIPTASPDSLFHPPKN